jgi:hypothetical protein
MQEHMTMMKETMGKMQGMKPRDGLSPQEQKEWIAEHQKLMDEMMGQNDAGTSHAAGGHEVPMITRPGMIAETTKGVVVAVG